MLSGFSSWGRHGSGGSTVRLLLSSNMGSKVDVVGAAHVVNCRSMFHTHLVMDVHDFHSYSGVNGDVITSEAFDDEATVVFPITVVHLAIAKDDFQPLVWDIVGAVIVNPKVVVADKGVGSIADTKIKIDAYCDTAIS